MVIHLVGMVCIAFGMATSDYKWQITLLINLTNKLYCSMNSIQVIHHIIRNSVLLWHHKYNNNQFIFL